MKRNRFFIIILLTASLALLTSACKKQDSPEVRKKKMIFNLIGHINSDSLSSYVSWLENMGTRFALAGNNRHIAIIIKNRYSAMGYETEIDSFMISKSYGGTIYDRMVYNIIATLEGSSSSDSVCIIGSHFDDITSSGDPFTLAPGANDNASGTAATLEIARVMKETNFMPSTTIRFLAFDAEEQGLLGSYNYTLKISDRGEKVRFMLNNDMIGYEPDGNSSSWLVNILDYDNSHYLRQEAEALCLKYTLLHSYNDNTYSHASDSYPFYLHNYKALFFFANIMDPNYHSINDVVSNFNFAYYKEIVKLNCAILAEKN